MSGSIVMRTINASVSPEELAFRLSKRKRAREAEEQEYSRWWWCERAWFSFLTKRVYV